jgi:hypothetical protein
MVGIWLSVAVYVCACVCVCRYLAAKLYSQCDEWGLGSKGRAALKDSPTDLEKYCDVSIKVRNHALYTPPPQMTIHDPPPCGD